MRNAEIQLRSLIREISLRESHLYSGNVLKLLVSEIIHDPRHFGHLNEDSEDVGKNRSMTSRFFTSDKLGEVVTLNTSKPIGKFEWVVYAASPNGQYLLLTPRRGLEGMPETSSDEISSIGFVPKEFNASPQNISTVVKRLFPLEDSDFNWAGATVPSSKTEEAHEKYLWDTELITIAKSPHFSYIVVDEQSVTSTYKDSTGAQTTAIGKALTSDVFDTLLDMTALAADITGLEFIGAAIGSAQVNLKIAKGDWLGLLMDIIGLVPSVGKAVESTGKTVLSYIKTAPQAIPASVIKAFKDALESVVRFITQSTAQKSISTVFNDTVSSGVTRETPLLTAAKKGYEVNGVIGAIVAMMFSLLGGPEAVSAVKNIVQSAESMISKLGKMLGAGK